MAHYNKGIPNRKEFCVASSNNVAFGMIKPCDLGINTVISSLPLPVIVPEHALIRLHQRLDLESTDTIKRNLVKALHNPHLVDVQKGEALIEFKIDNCKVGYLKAAIVKAVVVIKTFLFITNNGTPEGKKINTLLHIQKRDKKYWQIDKESTFMNSDLYENAELKNLFAKAGCSCLFQLKKQRCANNNNPTHIAHTFSNFLRKSNVLMNG